MPYKNYFGIDFGTTCSGVSVFQQNDEGSLTQKTAMHCGNEIGEPDSSFVAINKETDEVMCGYDAWKKRNKLALDHVLIPSVKWSFGQIKTVLHQRIIEDGLLVKWQQSYSSISSFWQKNNNLI